MKYSLSVEARPLEAATPIHPAAQKPCPQLYKITLLALSAFTFFSIQMSYPLPLSLIITSACILTHCIAEYTLRREYSSNWFNTDQLFTTNLSTSFIKTRFSLTPPFVFLLRVLDLMPEQTLVKSVLAYDYKALFLILLIAPLAEEVLFRGFLQERIEDLGTLAQRSIYPIPEKMKTNLACLVQSIVFGSVHILSNQVTTTLEKIITFMSTGMFGLILGSIKNQEKTLISPMLMHCSQNMGRTVGLLASNCFLRVPD